MNTTKEQQTGEGNAPRGFDTPQDLMQRSKAVFVRSLDGFVMGEADLKALLVEAQFQTDREIKLEAQRDELLVALKSFVDHPATLPTQAQLILAGAAISRVEGSDKGES